ncbi:MAG: alanine racemase [Dermatophilaceae bacterium]
MPARPPDGGADQASRDDTTLYQTQIRVHLANIVANLRTVRERVGPDRQILFAVKADGYGHGAVDVARAAVAAGVADWLGVATVPEGLELREAGIDAPILKLSATFGPDVCGEMVVAVRADIALVVCDRDGIETLQQVCAGRGLSARVHLKVDTGMGRIGCPPGEAPALAGFIERDCPALSLDGLMTHLPVSDVPDQDEFTAAQIARFAACCSHVEQALGRSVPAHCANSGGILGHPDSWLDMVRPGIMAYGSYPDPTTPHTVELLPGLSWVTRVSFVKKVAAGTSVSYGRTWVAPRDTVIATLPVGYGDGYDRHLSNAGHVLLGGRRVPIVGRVCMDQLMVDAGTDASVAAGDRVVLIGRDGTETISAEDMAIELGTIPYEVTCRISHRVPRIHVLG